MRLRYGHRNGRIASATLDYFLQFVPRLWFTLQELAAIRRLKKKVAQR